MRRLVAGYMAALAVLATPAVRTGTEAVVLSWIDGDTLIVAVGDRVWKVRLIGIDAPELSPGERARDQARRLRLPLEAVLQLGYEARRAASSLAPPGTRVGLELDVQATDRYGRLLAYLWLPGGFLLQRRLVEMGWAAVYTVPPNVRYAEGLLAAQRRARAWRRGLWREAGQ